LVAVARLAWLAAIAALTLEANGCGSRACAAYEQETCNTNDILVSVPEAPQAQSLDCRLTLSTPTLAAVYAFPSPSDAGPGQSCATLSGPTPSDCARSTGGFVVEFTGAQATAFVQDLHVAGIVDETFTISLVCGDLAAQVSTQALCKPATSC